MHNSLINKKAKAVMYPIHSHLCLCLLRCGLLKKSFQFKNKRPIFFDWQKWSPILLACTCGLLASFPWPPGPRSPLEVRLHPPSQVMVESFSELDTQSLIVLELKTFCWDFYLCQIHIQWMFTYLRLRSYYLHSNKRIVPTNVQCICSPLSLSGPRIC